MPCHSFFSPQNFWQCNPRPGTDSFYKLEILIVCIYAFEAINIFLIWEKYSCHIPTIFYQVYTWIFKPKVYIWYVPGISHANILRHPDVYSKIEEKHTSISVFLFSILECPNIEKNMDIEVLNFDIGMSLDRRKPNIRYEIRLRCRVSCTLISVKRFRYQYSLI